MSAEMTVENVIAFERRWYITASSKTDAIKERFGIEPEPYYERLRELLDTPEAAEVDAYLVRRLRALLDYRDRKARGEKIDVSIGYMADPDGFPGSKH